MVRDCREGKKTKRNVLLKSLLEKKKGGRRSERTEGKEGERSNRQVEMVRSFHENSPSGRQRYDG